MTARSSPPSASGAAAQEAARTAARGSAASFFGRLARAPAGNRARQAARSAQSAARNATARDKAAGNGSRRAIRPQSSLVPMVPTEMFSWSRSSILSMRPSRIQTTRSETLSIL